MQLCHVAPARVRCCVNLLCCRACGGAACYRFGAGNGFHTCHIVVSGVCTLRRVSLGCVFTSVYSCCISLLGKLSSLLAGCALDAACLAASSSGCCSQVAVIASSTRNSQRTHGPVCIKYRCGPTRQSNMHSVRNLPSAQFTR